MEKVETKRGERRKGELEMVRRRKSEQVDEDVTGGKDQMKSSGRRAQS